MALTDMHIVTRSLRARLFTTVTTVLSVAVAVALMLTLLSLRESGQRSFSRGVGNIHILVSADNSPLTSVLNSVFYAAAPQRPIPYTKFKQVAEDPRLDFAIPVQHGDSYRAFPTMATTPEFFTKFKPDAQKPFDFASGRGFQGTFDVVMGAAVARATGAALGQKLVLTHGRGTAKEAEADDHDHDHDHGEHRHEEHPYEVVGILAPTGSAHDRAVFITIESTWLIHADEKREAAAHAAGFEGHEEPTVENLKDSEKLITSIYLSVKGRPGSEGPPPVAGAVFAQLRADPSLTVALPDIEVRRLFNIVANVDQLFIAMALAVLVSSGIAIMIALYNSTQQRRRQIAVLRVLGAGRGRVFGLVLTESAMIGLLGAAVGLVLTFIGLLIAATMLKAKLGLVIDAGIDPIAAIEVLAGTVVLACGAGLIPAVMAYRTSVVRNLRPLG